MAQTDEWITRTSRVMTGGGIDSNVMTRPLVIARFMRVIHSWVLIEEISKKGNVA
jgi:hypothetical protein